MFLIYCHCQDDHYIGPSVDVWALGILLYFMVTGSMPFNASTVAALKTLILAGKFTVPSYVSPACGSLLRSILQRKSSSRPDLTGIMASDWMTLQMPFCFSPSTEPSGGRGAAAKD